MAAASGDDMDRHAGIEEGGLVTGAQVVEAQAGESERLRLANKFLRNVARPSWRRERGLVAVHIQAGKEQGIVGQLDQREVDIDPIGDAGLQTLQAFFLAQE